MCKWGTYKTVRLYKPRGVSGPIEVDVDACIAPLVQALNDAELETMSSCCGHGRAPGSVLIVRNNGELYDLKLPRIKGMLQRRQEKEATHGRAGTIG